MSKVKVSKLILNYENLYLLDKFFKEEFKQQYRYGTMGFFYWKMIKNLTQKGFVNTIFVDSNLAATTSITPKTLFFKKNEIKVAEIGDTYTKYKYRGRRYFTTLVDESRVNAEKSNLSFIYGTPNNQSMPLYLKYCSFEKSNIIKPYSFKYFFDIKSILTLRFGFFISIILNFFYKVFIKTHELIMYLNKNDFKSYNINFCNSFPDDIDKFWEEASKEWDFILSRKLKFLKWRFDKHPEKYFILIAKKDDKLIGYVTFRIINNFGILNLIISDFLFINKHIKAFDSCLIKIRNYAKIK